MSGAGLTLLPLLGFLVVFCYMGVHQVPEGHVGLYYIGGALQETLSDPGFHFMIPFLTKMASVQTTIQTDTVTDIPCGTSGGVMIYFDSIEVVNQLSRDKVLHTIKNYGVNYDKTWVFDKIHHEINQFCSAHTLQEVYIELFATLDEALSQALQTSCTKWDTGITIVAIRVTKPRIPEKVRKNYEEVEQQKTSLMVAQQEQMVAVKREETLRLQAKIQAEKEAEVSMINAQKEATVAAIAAQKEANVSLIKVEMAIKEKQGEQKKQLIENEMHTTRQKALAEAQHHQLLLEAETNAKRLTPEYLRLVLYQSLANNTKIYFGERIPQIFLDWLPASEHNIFPTIAPKVPTKP